MENEKRFTVKGRKGFSLVELLIAVVVLGILSSMLIAAGTASQNKARTAVAQNDLDSVKNSIYQALMAHPNMMKFKDTEANIKQTVEWLNIELDDAWQLDLIGAPTGSGLVAQTRVTKDPWGNPYGVYVYTNEHNKVYAGDASGTPLGNSDSCMYIIVVSSGRNATGGPLGFDGTNINPETMSLINTTSAINNSDGIDDLGAIIRIKNGTLLTASFGTEQSTLGTMKGFQWIYGEVGGTGGSYYDFKSKNPKSGIVTAGSIDQYLDALSLSGVATGIVGSWN